MRIRTEIQTGPSATSAPDGTPAGTPALTPVEVSQRVVGRRPFTLAELHEIIHAPDERLAAMLLRAPNNAPSAIDLSISWAIYERSVEELEREGLAWSQLLDTAVRSLGPVSLLPDEDALARSPVELAKRLTEWARTASWSELDHAIKAFTSGVARAAIGRGARDLTPKSLTHLLGYAPAEAVLENEAVRESPELSSALADWAVREITVHGEEESYAASTLSQLLERGHRIPARQRDDLLGIIDESGMIDHTEDHDDALNRCHPAAEVVRSPGFEMTSEEWKEAVLRFPAEAEGMIADLLLRADAPAGLLEHFVSRVERENLKWKLAAALDLLPDHPDLRADRALRRRFFALVGAKTERALIPLLDADEYWAHAQALREKRRREDLRLWLTEAQDAHRAGATHEILLPLLQHADGEVRLRAQAILGGAARGTPEVAGYAADVEVSSVAPRDDAPPIAPVRRR
jgi:hypothetical protein